MICLWICTVIYPDRDRMTIRQVFRFLYSKKDGLPLPVINVMIFYKPSVLMEGYLYFFCEKETKFIIFALPGN
jgi:RecB family endonuclease NucS